MVSSCFFLNSHFGCNEIYNQLRTANSPFVNSDPVSEGIRYTTNLRLRCRLELHRRINPSAPNPATGLWLVGHHVFLISCGFKVKYCKRKTLNNGNWIFEIRPTKRGSGLHILSGDDFTDFCLLHCKSTMNSRSGLSVSELGFCLTPSLQRTDFKISATLLHQSSHHFKMNYFKPDKAAQDLITSPKEVLAVPSLPSITPQPPTVSSTATRGLWVAGNSRRAKRKPTPARSISRVLQLDQDWRSFRKKMMLRSWHGLVDDCHEMKIV